MPGELCRYYQTVDNLTHSLAGLALAESVNGVVKPRHKAPLYLAGILASNWPDFDPVYLGHYFQGPLVYLLEHRGFSHTLISTFPQALIMLLGFFLWQRWRKPAWTRPEWSCLLIIALAGPPLHMAMDFINNYGVHLFWPLATDWTYGDAVFIVEPLFWFAILPALFLAAKRKVSRYIFGGIAIAGLALVWFPDFVPISMKVAYPVLAALLFLITRSLPANIRAPFAGLVCLTFVLSMITVSGFIRDNVKLTWDSPGAGDRLETVVRTPYPANPFCWQVWAMHTDRDKDLYAIRQGRVDLGQTILGTGLCPDENLAKPTTPMFPISVRNAGWTMWQREFRASLLEFKNKSVNNCAFGAFLSFARLPVWWPEAKDGQEGFYFADLRYDRGGKRSFAKFHSQNVVCPMELPPWKRPTDRVFAITD